MLKKDSCMVGEMRAKGPFKDHILQQHCISGALKYMREKTVQALLQKLIAVFSHVFVHCFQNTCSVADTTQVLVTQLCMRHGLCPKMKRQT